ncbi:SDR family oxidoreductase [Aureimonas sp. OT7]|uniref:SDR family NAD(P)-dependent oxidoreductase n=1 Tax=Aureimonas sp. OT7 TaxID=2816454 RepID=UPI001786649C|nr:SDR family NAD(P)-dependent oxidoreductase [Aureimonas sp. OT7]QOG07404.1 SDR family oxidoreductase [Aureimonas sp. OT7]
MKTGRTIVVTGAAGGIGKECVHRFLANDDTVIATDTSDEALRKLADELANEQLHVQKADITDEGDGARLAELAQEKTGRVDVLVNVAGFFPVQPFLEMSAEDWRKIIDINLTGTALMCRAMLPLMTGRGWGRIVNIGSASVNEGVPGQAHYVSAKAGVIGLTRSLAREFGDEGITVNLVAPGVTITPNAAKTLPKDVQAAQIEKRAIKREEKPADLVGPVLFFASPDSDFVTGQTLVVDGGHHMS